MSAPMAVYEFTVTEVDHQAVMAAAHDEARRYFGDGYTLGTVMVQGDTFLGMDGTRPVVSANVTAYKDER